jgi:predicted PurR-regulated permease PerM
MLLTKAEHRWLARTLPGVAILTWSAVGLLFLWLLGHVPQAVLVLVFGAVIGFAVEPLASLFTRFMPRGLAVGLGYVVGLGVVGIAIGAFATMASAQMGSLVTELPRDFHRIQHLAQPFLLAILKPFGIRDADLNRLVDNLVGAVQGVGTSASTDLLGTLNQGFTLAGSAVLALILSVYFVFNAPTIGAWLREHAPASQKPRVIRLPASSSRWARAR